MKSASLLALVAALGVSTHAQAAAGSSCKFAKVAELPVTMVGFTPTIHTKVNGQDATFIVDSGAFYSTISPAAAARLGLKTSPAPFGLVVSGVGGTTEASVATVKEFALDQGRVPNIQFLVAGETFGADTVGLLGQNILRAYDVEYDLANGVIRLFDPRGCGDLALIYWAGDKPFTEVRFGATTPLDPHINAPASVNGDNIRAILDTGAPRSTLSLKVAARAGVTPQTAGVLPGGRAGGIGRKTSETWIAPFQSFAIGGEKIANTKLRIGDTGGPAGADMLLGADFFLSHRVMVSNSQHKLYFTYNGGRVFNFDRIDQDKSAVGQTAEAEKTDTPTDAAGFARRGAAFQARGDRDRAIADFTRAVELAPANPDYLVRLARSKLIAGRPILAMSDLDQALALKPDHVEALLLRGRLYLSNRDQAHARADFDAALKPADNDGSTRLEVAGAYQSARLFEAAIGQYDAWIAANPKSRALAEVLNARCWSRATWGKELDKALADCDASLKLAPRAAQPLDSRGLVRLRMGQPDQAIADYDAALAIQPRQAWSLYGRGLARLRKGMKDEGEADLTAAAALQPRIADEAKSYGVTP